MTYRRPLERLVDLASELSGIDAKSLKDHCRFEHIYRIRHAIWLVATEHPPEAGRLHRSLAYVAGLWGFDHTSVLHGARRTRERLEVPEHDIVLLVAALREEWRKANDATENTFEQSIAA